MRNMCAKTELCTVNGACLSWKKNPIQSYHIISVRMLGFCDVTDVTNFVKIRI